MEKPTIAIWTDPRHPIDADAFQLLRKAAAEKGGPSTNRAGRRSTARRMAKLRRDGFELIQWKVRGHQASSAPGPVSRTGPGTPA